MTPVPTPNSAVVVEANAPTSTNALAPQQDADTCMRDATVQEDTLAPPAPAPPSSAPKKRKRNDKPLEKQAHVLHQSTFRKTTWSYFHLVLLTPGTASTLPTSSTDCTTTTKSKTTPSISPLLASSLLTAPLRAYLGTTGTAIPIDMLKVCGRSIWLRIPRQDARGFRASLSGWVGTCEAGDIPGIEGEVGGRIGVAWRVVAEAGVLGVAGDGGDLFG